MMIIFENCPRKQMKHPRCGQRQDFQVLAKIQSAHYNYLEHYEQRRN